MVLFVHKKNNRALIVSARDMTRSERKRYEKNKSSISRASSYEEIGEFWDSHDLSEYWAKTKPVEFEIDIKSEVTYYPVEGKLSARIVRIAKRKGVSPGTLLNLWLQERVRKESKRPTA